MVDEKAQSEGPAPQAGAQPSMLRKGLIAGWWNPMMDRYGPKNPALRFIVDLLPFLILFGIIGIAYLVSR